MTQIFVTGTVAKSVIVTPKGNDQHPEYGRSFAITLSNPQVEAGTDPQLAALFNMRVKQPTGEYTTPSVTIGVSELRRDQTPNQRPRVYDAATMSEVAVTKDIASGQVVRVAVNLVASNNGNTAKYGNHAAYLVGIIVQDASNPATWYTPSGIAGFKPLDDTAQPVAPVAEAPAFGAQPTAPVAQAPTFGAQPTAQPTAPAFGAQPATEAPVAPAFGAQPTAQPTAPTFGAQPAQPEASVFGAQTAQPTAPAFGAQPTAQPTVPAFGAQATDAAAVNPFLHAANGATGNAADPFGGNAPF
jgi:hypothetical protein